MIAITESEKKAICKKYPHAQIVRTMKKDSKRHHYYMVEQGAPMKMLRDMREHGPEHRPEAARQKEGSAQSW